jgi:biopolymer transport protein ExbD
MKTTLLIILVALGLARSAQASGAPAIFITTTDTGIHYRLMDYNRRTEKEVKTLEEVEAWGRDRVIDEAGDLLLIYPDDRTSFKALMEVMRRLKTLGVKQFAAGSAEANGGLEVMHYFQGKVSSHSSARDGAAPAAK